jgi:hypothetical protein
MLRSNNKIDRKVLVYGFILAIGIIYFCMMVLRLIIPNEG